MTGRPMRWWWWAALATLVVNDHLLKGASILPAVVTGKLSDVAGLIVAPVLACAVLRAGTPRVRLACFAAIAVPFVAIKTLPAATAWLSHALTAVGLPSRMWCDPTDLLALAVLPWVWRNLALPPAPDEPRRRALAERAGIAIAAVACMATSVAAPEDTVAIPPFLINATRLPVTAEVGARFDAGCSADAGDASMVALTPPALTRRVTLEPGALLELGEAGADAGGEGRCGVARVRLAHRAEITFAWDAELATPQTLKLYGNGDAGERPWQLGEGHEGDAWPVAHALVITGASDRPRFLPAMRLQVLDQEPAP